MRDTVGEQLCKQGLFGWPGFMLAALIDTEAITHGAGMSRMYS